MGRSRRLGRDQLSVRRSETRSTAGSATGAGNSRGLGSPPENNSSGSCWRFSRFPCPQRTRPAIHCPRDEALGARPWDQQWALRMQQVLAYETDPLEYEDTRRFAGDRGQVKDHAWPASRRSTRAGHGWRGGRGGARLHEDEMSVSLPRNGCGSRRASRSSWGQKLTQRAVDVQAEARRRSSS